MKNHKLKKSFFRHLLKHDILPSRLKQKFLAFGIGVMLNEIVMAFEKAGIKNSEKIMRDAMYNWGLKIGEMFRDILEPQKDLKPLPFLLKNFMMHSV